MGLSFTTPLAEPEPLNFDLPEWKRKEMEEEHKDFLNDYHKRNAAWREKMSRHNTRVKDEEEKFKGDFSVYRQNWKEEAVHFRKKYRRWTSDDLTNLRGHFEVAVKEQYLLFFSDLNEMLDLFEDDTSPERRRQLFDAADTQDYKAINFVEFLELMNNINIGTPVPRPAGIEENHEEINLLCAEAAGADPFKRMCNGLF